MEEKKTTTLAASAGVSASAKVNMITDSDSGASAILGRRGRKTNIKMQARRTSPTSESSGGMDPPRETAAMRLMPKVEDLAIGIGIPTTADIAAQIISDLRVTERVADTSGSLKGT